MRPIRLFGYRLAQFARPSVIAACSVVRKNVLLIESISEVCKQTVLSLCVVSRSLSRSVCVQ